EIIWRLFSKSREIMCKESIDYQVGLKERYKVERTFGEARKWHGYVQCRYLGFVRHAVQSYLTSCIINAHTPFTAVSFLPQQ
ncbi:hypothetical protein ACFL4C_04405, partial [Candidatus Omnitrophota bacterium]